MSDDATLRCSACGDETQATRGCYSPKCSRCGGPRVETRSSAIEGLRKAREAVYGGVWTWERHGDGWALYVDRGQPLFPDQPRGICNIQHGLNILTVGSDGFDSRGEQLRAFILAAADKVPALATERDARDEAWARLVKAECAWHDQTVALDGERDRDMKGAYAEVDAARQTLRDLGVDVDALTGET